MHWSDSLLLVNPTGRRYRPPPAADSLLLDEARREWTSEELRERYRHDTRTYHRLLQERRLAEHPEAVEAPAGWSATIAQLAAEALVRMVAQRHGLRGSVIAAVSLMDVRLRTQRVVRRRAARRCGVTLHEAPRPGSSAWTYFFVISSLRLWAYLRRRDGSPSRPWPLWLAVCIVRELEERRSWRQAMRTSTGRAVSSD